VRERAEEVRNMGRLHRDRLTMGSLGAIVTAAAAFAAPLFSAKAALAQAQAPTYDEHAGETRTTELRPNRPLLVTGAAVFAAPYVAGVVVAAQSNLEEDHRLYIPVAGPWLDLGQRPCSFGSDCSTGDNVASVLLIGSGVAQGLGVIMAVASFGIPETRTTQSLASKKAHVAVTPVSFKGGGGIGATGVF
jgi:hypothetical protein